MKWRSHSTSVQPTTPKLSVKAAGVASAAALTVAVSPSAVTLTPGSEPLIDPSIEFTEVSGPGRPKSASEPTVTSCAGA